MKKIRIGIDFGYKFTGIAVLDQYNKVLDYTVVQHRTDITGNLLGRRTNRSARRRKHTQIVRLRNFYALLKGMGIEPQQKNTDFIGNQLYAMAHRRGWDYSSLIELLIDSKGGTTSTVRKIDKMLIENFQVPHTSEVKKRNNEKYTVKKINNTCLGELTEHQKSINGNEKIIRQTEKDIDNKSTITQIKEAQTRQNKAIEAIQQAESRYEKLHYKLDNAGLDEIEEYIYTRLQISGVGGGQEDQALEHILVLLGLDIGARLHKEGKLYTPHRNRHRNEFVKELKEKIQTAFGELSTIEKAEQLANQQNISVEKVKGNWLKNAIAVLDPNNTSRGNPSRKKNNKDIRPARFENRHTGKCPTKLESGSRCNCNLPKKSRQDIRKLQFEVEARQMNIKGENGDRKLTKEELNVLIQCVDFAKPELKNNDKDWNDFFDKHKTPRVKEDARGKKDILKDIAVGIQAGRSGLCKTHLQEKLTLLEKDGTKSKAWQRLHEERILSIYSNDAPPSIAQKNEIVINSLKKILKKQDYDLKNLPIEHIGIETARFDISALAQNEGKKLKNKKDYQKKSTRSIEDIKKEQGDKCLYCGNDLGFATIEHIFAKALGGSDKALNRAVAHDICNINKGKGFVQIDSNVLKTIKTKNPKKYEFIQKGIKNDWMSVDSSLAGAQHTMFGAKLLKGSLITALGLEQLSEDEIQHIFPKVKPRETAFLRKKWFLLMDRQKSAIRYRDKKDVNAIKITIDEKLPEPLEIKWSAQLPDNIEILLEKPEKLKVWIKHHTENKITTVSIDEGHTVKQGDEGILSYRFNATDKTTGEIKQYKKLHIIIQPSKNDGINNFHHAIDAIISASSVNWNALNLTDSSLSIDDKKYRDKFNKAVANIRPKITLKNISVNGELCDIAPETTTFLKVDKQDQSRIKCSKTDTQALRFKYDKITQRKALYVIAEKSVNNIQSHRIRSLMLDAFADIKKMTDDCKKIYLSKVQKDIFITQDYFLTLKPMHKLHPVNTRSVRCSVGGVGQDQMFKIIDKNNSGEHFYKATKKWGYVVVYEQKTLNKKDKIIHKRFFDKFYVNKNNPQMPEPENQVEVKRFKSGDEVTSEKHKGLWRIAELGKNAVLTPLNIDAQKIKDESKGKVQAPYKSLELSK